MSEGGERDWNAEIMKDTLEATVFITELEDISSAFNPDGVYVDRGVVNDRKLIALGRDLHNNKDILLPKLWESDPELAEQLQLALSKLELFLIKNKIEIPELPE